MTIMDMTAVLAMATPPAGQGGQQGGSNPMFMIGYMVIIFALFYFMLIRPQSKKEKERRKMIEAVKTGDRILFSGGIIGTVANVKDQILVVKIADNVKIDIARGAIVRVLSKDEDPGEVEKAG